MPSYPNFFAEHVETAPRDQLEQLQLARLTATLEQTYENSPLMRALWLEAGVHPRDIQSLDDFRQRAPFFDKDSIRNFRDNHNDPTGGLIRLDHPRITSIATTSGTTGDPTPLPRRLRYSSEEAFIRDYWYMGARPGDHVLVPSFTFRAGPNNCISAMNEAGFIPIVCNHTPADIPFMIKATRRFKPTLFALMSSPLMLAFEQRFAKTGEDPQELFASYKSSIFGGETPSPRLKAMAQAWGLELFEVCAAGDVVSAVQCREHNGFHVYEDLAFVECVDPFTGEPVPDGEVGEMVATNIYDPLLAMVRFRTDDLVTINREPCSCGRTTLRFQIMGRKSDQIIVQGQSVLPRDIRPILELHEATSAGLFQIIRTQREMETLALRVGYEPEHLRGSTADLIDALQDRIISGLGIPVRVQLTLNDELLKLGPPHKIPRVTKQ